MKMKKRMKEVALELELVKFDTIEGMPDYTCSECFYQGEKFKTIKYRTPVGTEYDMECPECGSVEIEESPSAAFDRMRGRWEAAVEKIRELREQVGTCNMCLYLIPKEREQTGKKEPHVCRMMGRMLHHRGVHPAIPKPDWCPFMRTMSMEE